MDTAKLKKLLKWLTISFVVIALWLVTAFLLAWNKDSALPIPHDTIALFVGLPGIAASWVFIINLWRLAKSLNCSPIIWVGLTLIFSPIGPFVSYFIMRQKVIDALQDKSQTNNQLHPLAVNTIKNKSSKKYVVIAAIIVMLGIIIFSWNKFLPNQAVGEWRRELCIGKNNYKEDLIIFKDGTAISWLTSHGECQMSPNFKLVCSEDESWGKEGCDWSAKSENMILLRCHVGKDIVRYRTFTPVSRDHGVLDDKEMSKVTGNAKDDFHVPPVCN